MKAIIIHTFEDDGTERIQKLQKKEIGAKLAEILDEEATRKRKPLVLFREDADGNMAAKLCGTPFDLVICAGKIIENVSEEAGVPKTIIFELLKEILNKMEER